MFSRISVVWKVGILIMLTALMIIGANTGYVAESPEQLKMTDELKELKSAELPEEAPRDFGADPLTEWIYTQFASVGWLNNIMTDYIAVPLLYAGLTLVSEPIARFVYYNQWIPIAFWKILTLLGMMTALGLAIKHNYDIVKGAINV